MEDEVGCLLFMIIAMMVLLLVVGVVFGIIGTSFGHELEDVTIECVITHMDIDDGNKFITVVGVNSDFAGTIRVTSKVYANYTVGDKCIVVQHGYHYPTGGDVFSYTIAE